MGKETIGKESGQTIHRNRILKTSKDIRLGEEYKIYIPKLRIQKFKNNKLINKDFNLLGDYLLDPWCIATYNFRDISKSMAI